MENIAVPFDFNVICQVCRKKIKASESLKRWDNLIVCSEDYEMRHPADLPLPRIPEERKLPFTSPEGVNVEITTTPHALAGSETIPDGTFDDNNGTL